MTKALTATAKARLMRLAAQVVNEQGSILCYSRGAWRVKRGATPWTGQILDAPKPVKQCDGSWRTPLWDPFIGTWIFTELYPDTPQAIVSRDACGDAECIAIHEEDLTADELRRVSRGTHRAA